MDAPTEELEAATTAANTATTTATATATAMKRSTSSFLNAGGRRQQADIPLIELRLENITYAPLTNRPASTATASAGTRDICCGGCFGNKKKMQQQQQQQQHTTILHNVSTTISPGKMTAWMGPSGSGKSSLLSIAAGLVSPTGSSASQIYVNGEAGRIPKRFVGIVWQEDLLLSHLTVYENIYYAARLKTSDATAAAAAAGSAECNSTRSDRKISNAHVRTIVDETIQELGLAHVRDMLVGNALAAGAAAASSSNKPSSSSSSSSSSSKKSSSVFGNTRRRRSGGRVSGGERKRVSVACELVVRPSLLLLDEPTSGLDSSMALSLIKTLRYLADTSGHSIAVVIHQPRTTIFNLFDSVLLLSAGHVVYNGPTAQVRNYLESCPGVTPLPAETGISDWMLDEIIRDEKQRRVKNDGGGGGGEWRSLPSCWEEHEKALLLLSSSGHDSCTTATSAASESADEFQNRPKSTLLELQAIPKFETSFRTQLWLLTQRTHKQQRGERLTATAVYLQLVYIFFTSLFWYVQLVTEKIHNI
jgi:ABC-type multidrug transport system ATPase subunit